MSFLVILLVIAAARLTHPSRWFELYDFMFCFCCTVEASQLMLWLWRLLLVSLSARSKSKCVQKPIFHSFLCSTSSDVVALFMQIFPIIYRLNSLFYALHIHDSQLPLTMQRIEQSIEAEKCENLERCASNLYFFPSRTRRRRSDRVE